MTGAQLHEARKLLGWSADRLTAMSRINAVAIIRYEKTGIIPLPRPFAPPDRRNVDRVAAIRTVLEAAGVVFTDGEEPGVKLSRAIEAP